MRYRNVIRGSRMSIVVGGAKKILGCYSRICNKAVRENTALDTLKSHWDKAMLKWWCKLASIPEDRYPKQLSIVKSGYYLLCLGLGCMD